MTNRLDGKLALITGGASGIGRASAALFAGEGARVVITDINSSDGKAAVAEIEQRGGTAVFVEMDVTDERSVADAFTRTRGEFGIVNVLYNCAGGSTNDDAAVHELSTATVDRVLALELKSVMLCCRRAIPPMIESGGGTIINMASFVAFRGAFDIHAYSAAKGALVSLTRTMAGSYAQHGIRVNAIAPGVALSERAAARIRSGNIGEVMTFRWSDYPFAMGTPVDIAHLALFLASDESRMVNAQTISADGGLSSY
jgi:NAD(P)-dependent dehydrogenase (short-subunit alcohol dehydrogenase family)